LTTKNQQKSEAITKTEQRKPKKEQQKPEEKLNPKQLKQHGKVQPEEPSAREGHKLHKLQDSK